MKKMTLIFGIAISMGAQAQVTTSSNNYTSTSYLGSSSTSTEKNLIFKTDLIERMRLTSTGILGFNTTTPNSNAGIHLHQKMLFLTGNTAYGGPQIIWGNTESDGGIWGLEYNPFTPGKEGLNFWRVSSANYLLFLHNNGKIGVNTNNPTAQLTVNGNMLVGDPASVTLPSGYKLYVQTGILTERLKVAVKGTANWADYVFDQNYKLLDLKELDEFIKLNKHLPNIPSADEMVNNGLDVAEMDALLLSKIEELTLYVIELKKELEALKQAGPKTN
ncbi:hypothetical protein D3C71_325430 [compost metagenome]